MGGSSEPPTLYDWAGGREAFERLIDAFYDRVERDELISPLFPGGVMAYVEWGGDALSTMTVRAG